MSQSYFSSTLILTTIVKQYEIIDCIIGAVSLLFSGYLRFCVDSNRLAVNLFDKQSLYRACSIVYNGIRSFDCLRESIDFLMKE